MKLKHISLILTVTLMVGLNSCGNDKPTNDTPEKKKENPATPGGKFETKVVRVADYGKWTYVDIETGATRTLRDFSEWGYQESAGPDEKPHWTDEITPAQGSISDVDINWAIAFHRYNDVRTNGGEAIETNQTDFNAVTSIPKEGFTPDSKITRENTDVITDLSNMLSGKVGLALGGTKNDVLSKWLKKIPQPGMPPFTLELSNKVYILKTKEGKVYKFQFIDYRNDEGEKGFVKFKYQEIK